MTDLVALREYVRSAIANSPHGRISDHGLTLETRFYPNSRTLEITWLKASIVKQGIGRVAIEELQAFCAKKQLTLTVMYPTDRARDFYEHLHFVAIGEHYYWQVTPST
ncbi:MAG: hypothetical protein RLZZ70_413 [Candidatus Parcubacteria bacterium]|jgi:hypothetical protein